MGCDAVSRAQPDVGRAALWTAAEARWLERSGDARYLAGSHIDRQSGSLETHRWRRRRGMVKKAMPDRAGAHTKDAKGRSRLSTWRGDEEALVKTFRAHAGKAKELWWYPEPYRRATLPGTGREILIPGVYDRTVLAVLVECIEEVVETALSPYQHGYRREDPGLPHRNLPYAGAALGSTEVVARRLFRARCAGMGALLEYDLRNAYPSCDRGILRGLLVEDGCSRRFAGQIVKALGNKYIDANGGRCGLKGIPVGNPVAPLLFNFYVRGVHERVTDGVVLTSYADNFFIAGPTNSSVTEELGRQESTLEDLALSGRVVRRVRGSDPGPEGGFVILGDWRISESANGQVSLEERVRTQRSGEAWETVRTRIPRAREEAGYAPAR